MTRRIVAPSQKASGYRHKFVEKYESLKGLLKDPRRIGPLACVFLLVEIILNIFVIESRRYTEIDWRAYMQEVEGFVNGTLDYDELRGETGPLVYPAGFVYIYTFLYWITSRGLNVKLAQYIFALLYVALLSLVLRVYAKTKSVPPYILILILCTSYRVHSIFVLRLFNDSLAMIFLWAAVNAFLDDSWYLGSLLYSLGVSVKMNVLLFAPALLLAYLTNLGLTGAIRQLAVCASTQLILALPFLVVAPRAYVKRAFDFGRIFEFRWTVNWRFVGEEVFVSPVFHVALLTAHLAVVIYFAPSWIAYFKAYAKLKRVERDLTASDAQRDRERVDMSVNSRLFVLPMFAANFIGVAFSRSLHYQFYVWYYHTLPYLAWHCRYSNAVRIAILGVIEICWNTYPSTVYSSAALHICHAALLYGLHKSRVDASKNN